MGRRIALCKSAAAVRVVTPPQTPRLALGLKHSAEAPDAAAIWVLARTDCGRAHAALAVLVDAALLAALVACKQRVVELRPTTGFYGCAH